MELQRALSARQLSMIAIGGAIGTGLFLASGNSIHVAGPGGAILAYLIVGIMVYFIMTALSEMSAYMPDAGNFCQYSSMYISPSFGFAMSVNYWFNWAITLAAEISAATVITQYWFPHISSIGVGLIVIALLLFLNVLSVKWFGESEYWLAMIKVATVIFFIIMGVLIISGVIGGGKPVYLSNWMVGDAPFHGGWFAVFTIMLVAGFSFQGTELIGVAVSESEDPQESIPKAAKLIFWRILIFYVFAIAVIGTLIPYTDPHLISATEKEVAFSPFTMVMKIAHVPYAATMINAVILSAVFSAANSGTYAASRTLYQMAKEGSIPKVFGKTTRRGVPIIALLLTLAVGSLAFLSSLFGNNVIYTWLLSASALSGFIAWIGICLSHIQFRKQLTAQGKLSQLPYRARFYPLSTYFALGMCIIILLGQDINLLWRQDVHWLPLLLNYSSLMIFAVLWLGFKYFKPVVVNNLDYVP